MNKSQAAVLIAASISFASGLALVAGSVPFGIGGGSAQGIPTDPGMRTTGLFTSSTPFSTLSATEFRKFWLPGGNDIIVCG
jgi:hypothetical protein